MIFEKVQKSMSLLFNDILFMIVNDRKATMWAFLGVAFALGYFVCEPFITIWSLNTLFKLELPYSFKTWVATVWIIILAKSFYKTKKTTTVTTT